MTVTLCCPVSVAALRRVEIRERCPTGRLEDRNSKRKEAFRRRSILRGGRKYETPWQLVRKRTIPTEQNIIYIILITRYVGPLVSTVWCVLGFWMQGRPPAMEGSC
jgi:hypothetical protein